MTEDRAKDSRVTDAQRRALNDLFRTLPKSYEECFSNLQELRVEFQRSLGAAFRPVMEQHLRTQPQTSPRERGRLTLVLAETLNRLGLSLATPDTGVRAVLVTSQDQSKYRLVTYGPDGQEQSPVDSTQLPAMRLIESEDVQPRLLTLNWLRSQSPGGPGGRG